MVILLVCPLFQVQPAVEFDHQGMHPIVLAQMLQRDNGATIWAVDLYRVAFASEVFLCLFRQFLQGVEQVRAYADIGPVRVLIRFVR